MPLAARKDDIERYLTPSAHGAVPLRNHRIEFVDAPN